MFVSFIRTVPSVPGSDRVNLMARGLVAQLMLMLITTGEEFRLALKQNNYILFAYVLSIPGTEKAGVVAGFSPVYMVMSYL